MLGRLIGGFISGNRATKAQKQAVEAKDRGNQNALNFAMQQANLARQDVQPYMQAGTQGLNAYQALLGMLGQPQQQDAINNILSGNEYQTYLQQGENALLQNASATGGLRGGNVQGALMELRPSILNKLMQDRLNAYQQLIQMGQNSAVGAGNVATGLGQIGANIYQQGGQQQAQGRLAVGQNSAYKTGLAGSFFDSLMRGF